ncbi:uncharacterized protein LOC103700616 [Phoenix dactylifera]|uniref:Uncharacterized protein LOC103700616 n=1 Tax=Phoenix dactylifera TaxID=42345 RepID=A0A8B7BL85_PHODC|nr:uncharacterized protein LOC103700616 [Phoenix dactylifera]
MRKPEHVDDQDLELLKAVAQAWHAQSGNPRPTKESDAQKNHFKRKPSRFKLEAITMASEASQSNWDFSQSLWDSYEIVTLSKKLDANLALDQPLPSPPESSRAGKRARETKYSLRNLLQRISSKRFSRDVEPRQQM